MACGLTTAKLIATRIPEEDKDPGYREGRALDDNHHVRMAGREPTPEKPEPPALPLTAQGVPL